MSGEKPQGLSEDGQTFWAFMNDQKPAEGNKPREIHRSDLLNFYRGDVVDKVKSAGNRRMETDHGYIQWLFPLTTVGFNHAAPVPTVNDFALLAANPDVREKMREHFELFTRFLGIRYDEAGRRFTKTDAAQWNNWLADTHQQNYLRITRVLKSLSLLGLEDVAREFFAFLQTEAKRVEDDRIGDQLFHPFTHAATVSCETHWASSIRSQETAR